MAYRIKPDERVADGLRRVAKKELRSARDELLRPDPPADEAIHEARKHIKKVRAVIELIGADDGAGLKASRKRLRAINRALSRLRDADAMVHMLGVLKKKYPSLFTEHAYGRARRRLALQKHDVMQRASRDGTWSDIQRNLKKLRRSVGRWQLHHRGFGVLSTGIGTTYRRGRSAMERAREGQRADDFHEWRKQIKALRYQLRLVQACAPAIRRDAETLHRAETCLGDEHNVVVLCAELSKDSSLCDVVRLRHAANQYQCARRKEAVAAMARMYTRKPGAFVRGIKRAWKAWQRREAGRSRKPRRAA